MKKLFSVFFFLSFLVASLGLALPTSASSIVDGDVIKTASSNAVYYISGGKKTLMVNRGTYSSWSDAIGDPDDKFSTLKVISQEQFDSIPFGQNITVRPASALVKFNDSDDLFVVGAGAKLHKLGQGVKEALYKNYKIVTLFNSFRANYYNYGNPVETITTDSNLPAGTLIREQGSSNVYYWDGVIRRLVSNRAFIRNRFRNTLVKVVDKIDSYGSVGDNLSDNEVVDEILVVSDESAENTDPTNNE